MIRIQNWRETSSLRSNSRYLKNRADKCYFRDVECEKNSIYRQGSSDSGNCWSLREAVSNFCLLHTIFFIFLFSFFPTAHAKKLTLNLQEAIYLSVRNHPDVQINRLDSELQRHDLQLALWKFKPHFSLTAEAGETKSLFTDGEWHYRPSASAGFKTSLTSPYGTQFQVSVSPQFSGESKGLGLSASISQPLLRGFGRAIVEQELENAKDQFKINRLMTQSLLQRTVNHVIEMYLMYDYTQKLILLDEETVARARTSLKQTEYFIQAGKKAGQERVTAAAYLARLETQLQDDQAHLLEARQQLLLSIGLDAHVEYDVQPLSLEKIQKKFHLEEDEVLIKRILEHDIQYKIDLITVHGVTTRGVLSARDRTRWDATFKINVNSRSQSNLVFGDQQDQSAVLSLDVPLDDQVAKQGLRSAEIALKKAEIALKREHQEKYLNALTSIHQLKSLKKSAELAEQALVLERKAHQLSVKKYEHGLIDGLTLGLAESQLKQAEWAMRNAQLNYLRALISLDGLLGNTLSTWRVPTSLQRVTEGEEKAS